MSLDDVFQRAGTAYSEGKFEEALQIYERAVLSQPSNAVLYANLSAILLKLNRVSEARKHAESAVQLCPDWAKAHYRKSEALRRDGDLSGALLSLCNSIRLDTNNRQTLLSALQIAQQLYANFPLADLKKLGLENDRFTILSSIGQLLMSDGALEEAVQILTWALSLDSLSLKIRESTLGCLGAAHYRLRNYRRAIAYFEQQLELCQDLGTPTTAASLSIAQAAEAEQDWSTALVHRCKRIAINTLDESEEMEERLLVGQLLLQLNRPDEALMEFEKCRRNEENEARITVGIGCALSLTGDSTECLRLLRSRRFSDVDLMDKSMEAVNKSLVDEGKLEESIEYLNQILQHATTNQQQNVFIQACILLCRTNLRLGKVSIALRVAKRLLRLGRTNGDVAVKAEALRLLATSYEQQNDDQSAIALWKKYVELVSNNDRQMVLANLELARIMEKIMDGDVEQHLKAAMDASNRTVCYSLKCSANSAMLRHLMQHGRRGEAEAVLQAQKELLSTDIDASSRSLIFEDIALTGGEESTSGQSHNDVILLEQSLTETQEANDPRRELMLLERIGDRLLEKREMREAEGFYSRYLALAKHLRIATHMQRAHAKLARFLLDSSQWKRCSEHAKSGLTLAKILHDFEAKGEMLLILAETELKQNNLGLASTIAMKAVDNAEIHDLPASRVKCFRILADVRMAQGNQEEAHNFLMKHLSHSEDEPDYYSKCRTLLDLANSYSLPALEALKHSATCQKMAQRLEHRKKLSVLFRCVDLCFSLTMLDESNSCLSDILSLPDLEDHKELVLSRIHRIPLHRQLPLILLTRELHPQWTEVLSRLRLLAPSYSIEEGQFSVTEKLLTAWRVAKWDSVLEIISTSRESIDSSLISVDKVELLLIEAATKLGQSVEKIYPKTQRESLVVRLYERTWSDVFWENCSLAAIRARREMLEATISVLDYDLDSFDKIMAGTMSGETEMISMWYEELVAETLVISPDVYPTSHDSSEVHLRIAAVIMAVMSDNHLDGIRVLESSKWVLDCRQRSHYGFQPPAPPDISLLLDAFLYVFSAGNVQLMYEKKNDTTRLTYIVSSTSDCFYSECLLRFLKRRGIERQSSVALRPTSLLISDVRMDTLTSSTQLTVLRGNEVDQSFPQISVLCLGDLALSDAVLVKSPLQYPLSIVLKKIAECRVLFVAAQFTMCHSYFLSAGRVPEMVIFEGVTDFSLVRLLLGCGTATVVQLSNKLDAVTKQDVINKICGGVVPADLPAASVVYGKPVRKTSSDSSLLQLRRIIHDDVHSFLVLARAMANKKENGMVNRVARTIDELKIDNPPWLLPVLQLNETAEINEIYNSLKDNQLDGIPPNLELLRHQEALQLFRVLFEDHIFDYESPAHDREENAVTRVRTPTTPKKIKKRKERKEGSRDAGYLSDGDYLVPPRRTNNRTLNSMRSSATVVQDDFTTEYERQKTRD